MNLIIPIADDSVVHPSLRPKWMWVHPNGNLMVTESLKGLHLKEFKHIYIGLLKKHVQHYDCLPGLESQMLSLGIPKSKLHLIVLPNPTRHQPETVEKIISKGKVKGSIFIKDADNFFSTTFAAGNVIAVTNLNAIKVPDPASKSYVTTDDNGLVVNIVEKNVISNLFCSGGYGFASAELYLKYYRKLKDKEHLFISHVIYRMLLDDIPFQTAHTEEFIDWGNLRQWEAFTSDFMTLFIDLDGTLVKNSGQHFPPYWGQTNGIQKNIDVINKLYDSGKVQVIITTSRKQEYKQQTLKQLEKCGIKYHQIQFGMYHAKRVLINDFSRSNRYKSCDAINIPRNSDNLEDYFIDYI